MQNNDSTPTSQPDDEISLLDILVLIAENIRLLVFGPILVAAAAYGIVSFLPKTYESTAWLRPVDFQTGQTGQTGQGMVAVLSSVDTYQALLNRSKDSQSLLGKSKEIALIKLRKSIKVTFNAKENYVAVVASAETPEQARSLCAAFIEVAQEIMRPRGLLADQIQEKMQIDRKALQDITAKLQQPTLNEKQAQSVSAIESQNLLLKQIEIEDRLLQLSFKLKGFGSETILQQPSLPEKPSSPKKSQVTIIAGILAGFILLVFTFFRAALRAASDDPESASKLARIRKSFSF